MECVDSSKFSLSWLTLPVASSMRSWPLCTWLRPALADEAAALHERATSLAVATISLNAVETNSTASRWRPAALFMSRATSVVLSDAFCKSPEAELML
ncbi:hypothetical protein D3C81_1086330 [compost metagenome]